MAVEKKSIAKPEVKADATVKAEAKAAKKPAAKKLQQLKPQLRSLQPPRRLSLRPR